MALAELQQLIPVLPIGQYFDKLGGIDVGSFNEINVMQPDYLRALDLLLTITPPGGMENLPAVARHLRCGCMISMSDRQPV